jgi:very-short-patch-repair endonuclease
MQHTPVVGGGGVGEQPVGVVSRAELAAMGVSGAAVDAWVRRARLHPVHRGVYAVGHRVLRVEGRRLAGVLACGPGAVLSHGSAGAHCGLLHTDPARVEVTAATSRRGPAAIRLHRARSLDARDTTTHRGIPTTTVARTLLDLAATVKAAHLERALAQAERLQLYDHAAITDVLARTNGHRGQRALAEATAREPKFTRSDFESRVLRIARRAGLPEPDVNAVLSALDHPRVEVDLHWPAHRLIVETDGWETHRTRPAFEADRAKDAALTAAGYRVVRLTWRTSNPTIERRLRALLRQGTQRSGLGWRGS